MYSGNRRIGEILLAANRLQPDALARALAAQGSGGEGSKRLGEILVEMEAVSEADVAEALAEQLDLDYRGDLSVDDVEISLLEPLQLGFCRDHKVLPIARGPLGIEVACADPLAVEIFDELGLLLGEPVEPSVAPAGSLTNLINAAFEAHSRQLGGGFADIDEGGDGPASADEASLDIKDLIEASGDDDAPVIRFVNSLFVQAVRERASDIHVEPAEREIRVRFRVDGVLKEVATPPKKFASSIVTRIKILAKLDIAEKRKPLDGRMRIKMAGKDIDIRVATAPAAHGERITMRLLDKSAVLLNVRDIGFLSDQLDQLVRYVHRPHGIILVTGPTGSGKTTTLYSCLSEINSPDKNILTIEDPVEYQLDGISQMQVNKKIDLTFATGLRSYLRHDPDVIMVGEIRDAETAEMAIQASLTGHLVFSTLHTNDAAGAFTRLSDMGVEPFLVASTVVASLAQRLVRRLCPTCKEAYRPTETEADEVGISIQQILSEAPGGVIYRPREGGCDACVGLGYKGRTGIYELLNVSEPVRQLVMARTDAGTIKRRASDEGMRSLREDGALKVLLGQTSISEVLRVTTEGFEDAGELSEAV